MTCWCRWSTNVCDSFLKMVEFILALLRSILWVLNFFFIFSDIFPKQPTLKESWEQLKTPCFRLPPAHLPYHPSTTILKPSCPSEKPCPTSQWTDTIILFVTPVMAQNVVGQNFQETAIKVPTFSEANNLLWLPLTEVDFRMSPTGTCVWTLAPDVLY